MSEDGSGGSCDGLPTYSAGNAYAAGDRVVNFVQSSGQNVVFVCNIAGWCSSPGAWAYEPGNGAHWEQAWSEEGPCGGGNNNQPPVADANGPYFGQVGESVSFSSSGSDDPDGNIVSYSWSFGDGSNSNAANPTHSYATAGTYNVSLTVTDDKNASASASTTATITGEGGNEAPTAEANGPYSSTVGVPISFSSAGSADTDGSITGYAWDFGDGSTSSSANPSHSYASTGNYTVTLRVTDNQGATATDTTTANVSAPGPGGDKKVIGYFTQWGIYGRNYKVKNIVTSGSAEKLTHIMYAFGNVKNGRCVNDDDTFADYEKAFTAEESVDGVADTWDGSLRGNFNQLRKLKQMYPNIKVVWSFGGWTWSGGFGQAAANPTAFAESCYNLVHDPRWDGVFDGIDMDWEYPNECGLSCDSSGFEAFGRLMGALRARFGNDELVTAAITASETKLDAANYAAAAQYVDFYMVMTYDFFGGWDRQGPTAPHSPLTNFPGIPIEGFYSDNAIQVLKSKGVPANKLLLGIGFYGRGWSGVTQSAPGGTATGVPMGAWEPGIQDYKLLKGSCPPTGTVAGTAYAHCGNTWWGYDTPETIRGKMNYVKSQNLGGAFFWEFNGDTTNGELINAISDGLK
ncbi:glycosyl hydrolase family 18 protein [Exilibacterium tricleocarpae]|uniref:glycosyl hydrolase family 18 protein n=1 Tax=Exilibacterium tricleocarpae TaxID=2591008 RepID=UPI003CCC4BA7